MALKLHEKTQTTAESRADFIIRFVSFDLIRTFSVSKPIHCKRNPNSERLRIVFKLPRKPWNTSRQRFYQQNGRVNQTP